LTVRLNPGPHAVKAVYGGDARLVGGASAALALRVPQPPAAFVLTAWGDLYEYRPAAGWSFLGHGVASLSNQGSDAAGNAAVVALTGDGPAYQYVDGVGWRFLAAGVTQAAAGRGVSYVLLNGGEVDEISDGGLRTFIASGVRSLSAGTDGL